MATDGFTGERVAASPGDVDGIDIAVIYGPEYDLWLEGIDPELQAAMVRAYNRWGAGHARVLRRGRVLTSCADSAERRQPRRRRDPIRPRRARHPFAFWTRPNFFNHRNLGDRYYDPIYELLQDLDVPFATHEFMGLRGQTEGADRFFTFTEWHTAVHTHEAMNACLSMITQGVFERFPTVALCVHGGRVRLAAVVAASHRRAPRNGRR